jgi:DNA-binding GntR family transcriptional regulator
MNYRASSIFENAWHVVKPRTSYTGEPMTAVAGTAKTLAESAYLRIRDAIRGGALPPGTRLRFAELQGLCGMSVTPVREALTRLTAEGFTTVEENRGYRVAPLSIEELWDIARSRQLIEGEALRLSIAKGGADWEGALVSAHHLMKRIARTTRQAPTVVDEDWNYRHTVFHRSLILACGSPILLSISEGLYDRADRYRRLSWAIPDNPRAIEEEHERIFESALARDAEAAINYLCVHYERTAQQVEAFLLNKAQPDVSI